MIYIQYIIYRSSLHFGCHQHVISLPFLVNAEALQRSSEDAKKQWSLVAIFRRPSQAQDGPWLPWHLHRPEKQRTWWNHDGNLTIKSDDPWETSVELDRRLTLGEQHLPFLRWNFCVAASMAARFTVKMDTDNWSVVGFGGDFITRTWDLVVQQKDFIRWR